MLLVWGFRTLFKILAEGEFHCPRCGVDRHYRLRLARRWFTFFWIPIFPYKKGDTHVECTTCHGTFYESVLAAPTTGQLSNYLAHGMRISALTVLRASGMPTTAARAAAVEAVTGAGVQGYTIERLDYELTQPLEDLSAVLVPLGGQLEPQGREWLVGRLVMIASADGGVGSAERAVIDQVGALLQMTPAHVMGVVETAQRTKA